MTTVHTLKPLRYRAIWLSDIHLGYRGCKADYLLDFLTYTESDVLYLVGDIVDLWSFVRENHPATYFETPDSRMFTIESFIAAYAGRCQT